jgi:hypothetical protein
MTREEIVSLCRKAHDVGAVKHEDFVDYVLVLETRRKVKDEWQNVEHAYMAVDGKLAMANEDHRKQDKKLVFAEPKILLDNAEQLTLQVTVTSEIYGVRHGIATSRKKGGSSAEREFPWEVAETSAIGRALSAMGYGLLPGAGLSSAEDVMRAGARDGPADTTRRPGIAAAHLMTANQRAKLVEMYRERHGGSDAQVLQGLDAEFSSAFKHPMSQGTFEQASKLIAQLSAQKIERSRK